MKECSECKENKPLDCFVKDNRIKCGYRSKCKECDNKRRRELYDPKKEAVRKDGYYQKNKDRIAQKQKEYYQKNKEEILKRNREWEKNNPEKRKAQRNKPEYKQKRKEYLSNYKKERYDNDPLYRLANAVRNSAQRITAAVKQQKEMRSLDYLGCSLEEFKSHIESLWSEGMTWDNHGDWHIDHKIPLDYFLKNSDDPWEANHYSNLQPLWAEENLSKGSSI